VIRAGARHHAYLMLQPCANIRRFCPAKCKIEAWLRGI
jgi:hypothetical protein